MRVQNLMRGFIVAMGAVIFLAACSTAELARLHPKGTYIDGMPPGVQPVRLVAQDKDQYNNYMPAFVALSVTDKYHKEILAYPVPSRAWVRCEKEDSRSRSFGSGFLKQDLQLGKTYNVYCELLPKGRYKIVAIEASPNNDVNQFKPSDENRVKLLTNGPDPFRFWKWQGGQETAIRNWDGKFVTEAELIGPREEIVVFCKKEWLGFPVKGKFEANKTYQIRCTEEPYDVYPVVEIKELN
ncbi:hypothetical protein [Stenoxybacter acetivorans]|uniref:hypothetical protein n=1 Tax=Stenoxybacter acetivorans TaxID=422441 RepID=UPI00056CBF38|nr:hypothetical protein [Stenoxybacter acetivorans]